LIARNRFSRLARVEKSGGLSASRASVLSAILFSAQAIAQDLPTTGNGLYEIGCAKCHGADGRGVDLETVGFDLPLPDLSDCRFTTRETDVDWMAVTHSGGPARGFSDIMPAFGEAFAEEQLQKILDFIRSFCAEPAWPRGELNFPKALVTEKAYPEDELIWTTSIAAEGAGAVEGELLYERRFGALNQIELKLPLAVREASSGGSWQAGVGDVAAGMKRALYHSLERGAIWSAGAEVVFPTGDEADGFGKGTIVFEPFLAFGKTLSRNGFFQLQAGAELPADAEVAEPEAFWRLVLGGTLTQGRWGRSWSPMVEILGSAGLDDGSVDWDVLPQIQVSLSARQHIFVNAGVRVPLTSAGSRDTQLVFYFLWDWFDGGLLEGW